MSLSWHEKVAYVGTRLLEEAQQAPVTVEHIFEPGVYIREITIPAGVLFVGRPHRFGHRVHFLQGRFRLIDEDGERIIEAPTEIFTKPGFLMVLETYTHHVGRTYHPNPDECRDTDLMDSLIFHSKDEVIRVGHSVRNRLEHTA